MGWNSTDPSKPGIGDAIKGIGEAALAVATGGTSAAGEAAVAGTAAAAGGEAAAAGGMTGRINSFLAGQAEKGGTFGKMLDSAKTEGSFLNNMNKSYGMDKAGNWAPNDDSGSHIITPKEASENSGNLTAMGQQMRDTGTNLS